MRRKAWTAAELERMTPAEQDAIFKSSIVTDLSRVPPEFLERVRDRIQKRIEDTESRQP